MNRDFNVLDRVVTPYFQAEYFYDTRYDGWAREFYQVGAEIGITRHFRVEPSLTRQVDRLPDPPAYGRSGSSPGGTTEGGTRGQERTTCPRAAPHIFR